MQKENSLNPENNDIEFSKKNKHKLSSLNKDKIYFFKTSLFTEKSKNIILRINSCHDIKNKKNEPIEKKVPKLSTDSKASIHQKKEQNLKIFLLEDKNRIQKIDEKNHDENNSIKHIQNNNNDSNDKVKKDKDSLVSIKKNSNTKDDKSLNTEKQSTSKTDLININAANKNYNCQLKCDIKSKTENKKENNINNEINQQINYRIVNNIQKCKLFQPLSNAIEIINRNFLGDYIAKSQRIIDVQLPKTNKKPMHLTQKKEFKLSNHNKKIKYKLNSIKNLNKEDDNNNKIISFKSIYNNNTMKKEKKLYKSISKLCNIQSFSIFDENYHISRYKLGNYMAKKNNRYHNKNLISEDKICIKKYIQKNNDKNNIFA